MARGSKLKEGMLKAPDNHLWWQMLEEEGREC